MSEIEDSVITSRFDGVGGGSCCTSAKQTTTDKSFIAMNIAYVYQPLLHVYVSVYSLARDYIKEYESTYRAIHECASNNHLLIGGICLKNVMFTHPP